MPASRVLLSILSVALVVTAPIERTATAAFAPAAAPSIVGAWTLNTELSDKPAPPSEGERGRGARGGGPGRGGGRGGRGGSGMGGRGIGGPGIGGGMPNREEMQRMQDARSAILEAPERLTIVQTQSTVIVTSGDGRTTRLAPDGSGIKDESTGITRRTRWDAGELVTEITGLGPGKILETYGTMPDTGNLAVTLTFEDGEKRPPLRRVYRRAE